MMTIPHLDISSLLPRYKICPCSMGENNEHVHTAMWFLKVPVGFHVCLADLVVWPPTAERLYRQQWLRRRVGSRVAAFKVPPFVMLVPGQRGGQWTDRVSDGVARGTVFGKQGSAYRHGLSNTAGTIMLHTALTVIFSDILAIHPRLRYAHLLFFRLGSCSDLCVCSRVYLCEWSIPAWR